MWHRPWALPVPGLHWAQQSGPSQMASAKVGAGSREDTATLKAHLSLTRLTRCTADCPAGAWHRPHQLPGPLWVGDSIWPRCPILQTPPCAHLCSTPPHAPLLPHVVETPEGQLRAGKASLWMDLGSGMQTGRRDPRCSPHLGDPHTTCATPQDLLDPGPPPQPAHALGWVVRTVTADPGEGPALPTPATPELELTGHATPGPAWPPGQGGGHRVWK